MTKQADYGKKPLTETEKTVLRSIAQGYTNSQIARMMSWKVVAAVDSCIDRIYAKLMLGNDVTREQLPERAGIVLEEKNT